MDIFDASSLLAFIRKESGYGVIRDRLIGAEKEKNSVFIHQVNYIETIYCCLMKFGEVRTDQIIGDLKTPFLGIVNYMDADLALYSSTLKSVYSLSLGDSIGLAFTKIMNGKFWTKDKALVPIAEKENIDLMLIK